MRFIAKIFTAAEIKACKSARQAPAYYAKRYAAKEAFLKALGTGLAQGIKWHDMEILNDSLGKPLMQIKGQAKDKMTAMSPDGIRVDVSLSDTAMVAFAVVIISVLK